MKAMKQEHKQFLEEMWACQEEEQLSRELLHEMMCFCTCLTILTAKIDCIQTLRRRWYIPPKMSGGCFTDSPSSTSLQHLHRLETEQVQVWELGFFFIQQKGVWVKTFMELSKDYSTTVRTMVISPFGHFSRPSPLCQAQFPLVQESHSHSQVTSYFRQDMPRCCSDSRYMTQTTARNTDTQISTHSTTTAGRVQGYKASVPLISYHTYPVPHIPGWPGRTGNPPPEWLAMPLLAALPAENWDPTGAPPTTEEIREHRV